MPNDKKATEKNTEFAAYVQGGLKIGKAKSVPLIARFSEGHLEFKIDLVNLKDDSLTLSMKELADWLEDDPFNFKGIHGALGDNLLSLNVEVIKDSLQISKEDFNMDIKVIGDKSNPDNKVEVVKGIAFTDLKLGVTYKKESDGEVEPNEQEKIET